MPDIFDIPINERRNWVSAEAHQAAVQALIAEVEQDERNAAWNSALILIWDVAVRIFRIVERQQLFVQTPNDEDLKLHEALLNNVIKSGKILEARIKNIDDEALAAALPNLSAYIRELEDTYLMWHGTELNPARASELEKAVFGGLA